MILNHKHIIIRATGLKTPITCPYAVQNWLTALVKAVGMKVLMGPYATRCDTVDNEGVTGVVVIETSHASIHIWDRVPEPYAQMDLYSCDDFDSLTVIKMFNDFGPTHIDYAVVDRNMRRPNIIETDYVTSEFFSALNA